MGSPSLINLPVLKSKQECHRNFQGPGTFPRDAWLLVLKAGEELLVLDKGPKSGSCTVHPGSPSEAEGLSPDAENVAVMSSLLELPWLTSTTLS